MAPKPPANSTVYMSSAERETEIERDSYNMHNIHQHTLTHSISEQSDEVRYTHLSFSSGCLTLSIPLCVLNISNKCKVNELFMYSSMCVYVVKVTISMTIKIKINKIVIQ